MKKSKWILSLLFLLASCSSPMEGSSSSFESSGKGIEKVKSICFVDKDGAKVKAVSIKYPEAIKKESIDKDTYDVSVYTPSSYDYIGDGEVSKITGIHVSGSEDSFQEEKEEGEYVILELFTDYLCTNETLYSKGIGVSVKQTKDVRSSDGKLIKADDEAHSNRLTSKSYDFVMDDISGFRYYTDMKSDFVTDGSAFHQEHCFSSIDGSYHDIALSYALYVPEDYKEDGHYALVSIQNPAANEGTHPFVSVLQTRTPAYFASKEAQDLVKKEHGLDGLLVLVPTITERVDDNATTPAEYEAVIHLWDHIIDTYHIDKDYIYGVGQSVGGMILLETNRNRDNFFAGILLYEDQWAQNYYMDTTFQRDMVSNDRVAIKAERHYPRIDAYITYDYHYDSDSKKVYEDHDPYNFYYLISDDNILIQSGDDVYLSIDSWREMKYLYHDLAGYDLENLLLDAKESQETIDSKIKTYLNRENSLNINWILYSDSHGGYTDRKSDETYQWLILQDRKEEMKRKKLDLNKPFEIADEQLKNEERKPHFTDKEGNPLYYKTGKRGAGTRFYSSGWLNLSTVADNEPGWLPTGMSWETGVGEAKIASCYLIDEKTVAIKFDNELENLSAQMKGDKVIDFTTGKPREDDFVLYDPFVFFDLEGNPISVSIENLYLNDVPLKEERREKLSGKGLYLIVELQEEPASKIASMSVVTTLHTDSFFILPSFKRYAITA